MNGSGSKRKGSNFELLTAKKILEAAGPDFCKKDCYRTPMSGGHQFAGKGDLKISSSLLEIFPFSVECKHRNGIRLDHFFTMSKELESFHSQVIKSAELEQLKPLLVIRSTNGAIYAAAAYDDLFEYESDLVDVADGLDYKFLGDCWRVLQFEVLLAALGRKAASRVKLVFKGAIAA